MEPLRLKRMKPRLSRKKLLGSTMKERLTRPRGCRIGFRMKKMNRMKRDKRRRRNRRGPRRRRVMPGSLHSATAVKQAKECRRYMWRIG